MTNPICTTYIAGPMYPRDCSELNLQERVNDTYTIYPYGVKHKPVAVLCIFDFNDVAWTVCSIIVLSTDRTI